jgi:GNAT superfamily N-acetyltransferase
MPEAPREVATLRLTAVGYSDPDAVALVAAVQAVYAELYGDGDEIPMDTDEFTAPLGCFLVGYLEGVPVACGGWRRCISGADPVLRDGDIELKRMYVVDTMRGRGFARELLAELERRAIEAGGLRMVLQTGTRQPEAIELYRSTGYRPITPFGPLRNEPMCRCFAKPLG